MRKSVQVAVVSGHIDAASVDRGRGLGGAVDTNIALVCEHLRDQVAGHRYVADAIVTDVAPVHRRDAGEGPGLVSG